MMELIETLFQLFHTEVEQILILYAACTKQQRGSTSKKSNILRKIEPLILSFRELSHVTNLVQSYWPLYNFRCTMVAVQCIFQRETGLKMYFKNVQFEDKRQNPGKA